MLAHFANLMQLPNLRRQLENYIENEVSDEKYAAGDENLLEMIVEAMDASFSADLMDILYQKLARIDLSRVKAVSFWLFTFLFFPI